MWGSTGGRPADTPTPARVLLQLSAIAVTGGLDPEKQDALFELRLNSQRKGNSGLSWEEPAAASAPLPCGASVRARLQPASADASQALSAALHVKRDRGRPADGPSAAPMQGRVHRRLQDPPQATGDRREEAEDRPRGEGD